MSGPLGRRLVEGGWLLPRNAERALGRVDGEDEGVLLSLGDVEYPRDARPRWTVVGSFGGSGFGAVDPAGLLTPRPRGWSLDWWIGADDRWHFPAREASVRQGLHAGVPVVETRTRVPGGDAVHRVYGLGGPSDAVVVEVENESPVPFAVAFSVRPVNPQGPAPVGSIEVAGPRVFVDGAPVLRLPRAPMRIAGGTWALGDCASALVEGEAEEAGSLTIEDPDRAATVAVVLPVAHRASIRVAVALVGGVEPPAPDGASPLTAVVRGWGSLLERGPRVELPDARLAAAVDAARAFLLLFDDGVEPVAAPWEGASRGSGAVVLAALEAWGAGPHIEELRASLPRRLRRRARDVPAADASRVERLLGEASPTFAWGRDDEGHHGEAVAEFLLLVRGLLCGERGDEIQLFPGIPPAWRGRPVEVHRLPTRAGLISYALRWHGPRPALLWECEREARLTAPALDRAWSTRSARGEALLEAPHTIAP